MFQLHIIVEIDCISEKRQSAFKISLMKIGQNFSSQIYKISEMERGFSSCMD